MSMLTRRDFIQSAIASSVGLAGLTACGGGSSSSSESGGTGG
ncbi:MAG: twin-arginine translocation signal domain-containing protein [Holophagaceae bacterium]